MAARQQGHSARRCHPPLRRTNLRKRKAGSARLEPPPVPPAAASHPAPLYKKTLCYVFQPCLLQRNPASLPRLPALVVQTLRPLRAGSATHRLARQTPTRAPTASALLRLNAKASLPTPPPTASSPRAPFALLHDAPPLGAKRATRDALDETQRRLDASLSRQRRGVRLSQKFSQRNDCRYPSSCWLVQPRPSCRPSLGETCRPSSRLLQHQSQHQSQRES